MGAESTNSQIDSQKSDSPGKHGHSALRSLTRNDKGELVAQIAGKDEPVVDVRVARCFPWSLPDSLVSIRDKDGNELLLLETLDGLPRGTRELIEQELRDKIFAPQIEKILSYENRFGIITIKARTDRGEITFQMRSADEVRTLSPTRFLLKDADGNLYEIADMNQLDAQSRRLLADLF